MSVPSSAVLQERLARLQAVLAAQQIDVAILQFATDLFYYTGSVQPLYLLVPPAGEARILARKAISRIADEAPQLPLHPFSGTKDLAAILRAAGVQDAKRVGFTLDTASYVSVTRLLKLFPGAEPVDLSWDVRTLRMVKSEDEIAVQARAGEIMRRVPELVRAHFRPGITELELSAALEYAFRLAGHDLLIRPRREGVEMSACGICVAGARSLAGSKFEGIAGGTGLSSAVPYGATRAVIAEGEPILIDVAFVLEGYHLDQTRMAVWGTPDPEVTRVYDAMLDVQQVTFAAMRPGASWEAVWEATLARVEALGYADTFMGSGREQVKFVGHGVGLELDEPPFLAPGMDFPLAAGMVVAVEPKVALPTHGVIGIEDTVVIRENGIQRLTVCGQELVII
jgi:Xaa-Pro aminopeptidase